MQDTPSNASGPEGPSPGSGPSGGRRALSITLNVSSFLTALYFFLLSVTLIGAGFKLFGKPFANELIQSTQNPFIGLFIGILATSLVQSSSATTSMVVGMVGSGTLTVPCAIPIIMGANIGTTVTNTLVSLGHITRKDEFQRALGGAVVHDFFNLITVAILLPLEIATGYLRHTAEWLTKILWGAQKVKFNSPLKAILKPVKNLVEDFLTSHFSTLTSAIIMIVAAVGILFVSLWVITRIMRRVLAGRVEGAIDRVVGMPIVGLVVGAVLTAIVQSSSAVTSILVPLAGAGILTIEQIFPITLGSNIGTTITAVLAALAVGPIGLTIALAHLLFNISGIALIYPVPRIRAIPIRLARWLAAVASESKRYAILYVLGVFFLLPGLLVLIWKVF